jgi:L-ribulose-5-phosphate 3-epimerase
MLVPSPKNKLNRREALLLAAAVLPLRAADRTKPKGPLLCVLSDALTGVWYAQIGEIVSQLGYDGVDFTMSPGGAIEPSQSPVDEVRAFESVHGAGLECPIATTKFISPNEPWARNVIALAGRTGVGLVRCGLKRTNANRNTRQDAFGLAYFGRQYETTVLIEAGAGGRYSPSEAHQLTASADSAWTGMAINSDCFAEGSGIETAEIEAALPFVKAAVVSDFVMKADTRDPKPLGKGSVDFAHMFAVLAKANFRGPITVERYYKTSDEPGMLTKDAEFIREQIRAAYHPDHRPAAASASP